MGGSGSLAARERWAVADVVASVLRHDLRNKLASIRNASFYLMRKVAKTDLWGQDPRVQTFFQLIDKELAAAEQVLVARAPPQLEGARPHCLLRDAAARAVAEARVRDTVKVEQSWEETGEVALEAEDAALVVWCLLDNALDALSGGGTLTVGTRNVEDGVALRVEDSGPGLDATLAGRATEPFVTTKSGHAGLGLSIVQRMAARHGAKVDIGRGDTGGMRVEVMFPRSPEATSAPDPGGNEVTS